MYISETKMTEEIQLKISEDAAPTQSALVQALNEAVPQVVGVDSLAKENAPADKSSLEAQTLNESEPQTVQESALTEYADVSATVVEAVPSAAPGILDPVFAFPPDYFKVVERSMKIGKINLSHEEPNQYPIARLDILNVLTKYRAITEKLLYATYVRFNLEVQIKVLATNFHYGQLMFVWRPAYAPLQVCEELTKSDDKYSIIFHNSSMDGVLLTCVGPYDNVFTASQLDHHILPVTAGANITLKLPWTLNRQYVYVPGMLHSTAHIGFLDVYQLTPIGPTDIDPPIVQIFGRFRDVVGFGYRDAGNTCATERSIRRREYHYTIDNNWDEDMNAIMPYGQNIFTHHSTQVNTSWSLVTTKWSNAKWKPTPWWIDSAPQSYVLADVVDEVVESGEIDAQHKGGALYQCYNQMLAKANVAAAWVGDALAFLGLSKPPMRSIPDRFIHMAPPMSSGVAPDFCVSTGVNPDSLVVNKRSDHSEKILISELCATPTYLGWYAFTNTTKRTEAVLIPYLFRENPSSQDGIGAQYRTPASLVLEKFAMWRCSTKYVLRFSSSSFVTARFSIQVYYDEDVGAEELGLVPTQIVEVKGDTTVSGEIPYLNSAPWKTWLSGGVKVIVQMLDNAVSWKTATTPPIYMSIWVSYPGMQVAFPSNVIDMGTPWFVDNIPASEQKKKFKRRIIEERLYPEPDEPHAIREVVESGRLPGDVGEFAPQNYGMNDICTSVYHLAKRFCPVVGRAIVPLAPPMVRMWYKRTVDVNNPIKASCWWVTYGPSNTLFAQCFRWVRGSYCYVTSGTFQAVDLLTNVITYTSDELNRADYQSNLGPKTYGGSFYSFAQSNNHSNACGQRLIASRSPFHSNYPYVSGPLITQRIKDHKQKLQPTYEYCSEFLNFTVFDGFFQKDKYKIPYQEFSFGDDLCYNQWMGVPLGVTMKNADQAVFPEVAEVRLEGADVVTVGA